MPETLSFPHGATGIEVGDFVVQVGVHKIVALAKGRDEHYTIHFGQSSGVVDLHYLAMERDSESRLKGGIPS